MQHIKVFNVLNSAHRIHSLISIVLKGSLRVPVLKFFFQFSIWEKQNPAWIVFVNLENILFGAISIFDLSRFPQLNTNNSILWFPYSGWFCLRLCFTFVGSKPNIPTLSHCLFTLFANALSLLGRLHNLEYECNIWFSCNNISCCKC